MNKAAVAANIQLHLLLLARQEFALKSEGDGFKRIHFPGLSR